MSPTEPLSPPEEERLARYRSGAMSEPERAEFERGILRSDALAEMLYSEQALDAIRTERGASRLRPRYAGWAPWVAAAAGVALIGFLGVRMLAGPAPDLTRGGSGPSSPPRAEAGVLTWPQVPEATHYRVTLLDANGIQIDAPIVGDTSLVLPPPAAGQKPAVAYLVTPLNEDGIELPALPLTPIPVR